MTAKIALLGCGNPARKWHLPTLGELAKRGAIEFGALCDMDERLAAESGTAYGVPHYTSAEELLDRHRRSSARAGRTSTSPTTTSRLSKTSAMHPSVQHRRRKSQCLSLHRPDQPVAP